MTTRGRVGRSLTTTTSPLWSLVIGHGREQNAGSLRGRAAPSFAPSPARMGKEGKPPTRSRLPRSRGIGGVGVQGSPLPRLTK